MFVHAMCALKKLLEIVVTNNQSNRQADGAPKTVSTTNPIPKLEHVGFVDTESGYGLGVGTKGHKVFRNMSFVQSGFKEPLACRLSVGDCFLGCESLASDDEKGTFWITFSQNLGYMGPVDVGNEMSFEISFGIIFEGLSDHDWTEIGTADANIDDRVDGIPSVPFPIAISDSL